jgi:hypothetical protein
MSYPDGPSLSWLVRCWQEPLEQPHGKPILRCYVRDLRTGEERYLNDPRELGEMVLRKMREAARAGKRGERAGRPAEKVANQS